MVRVVQHHGHEAADAVPVHCCAAPIRNSAASAGRKPSGPSSVAVSPAPRISFSTRSGVQLVTPAGHLADAPRDRRSRNLDVVAHRVSRTSAIAPAHARRRDSVAASASQATSTASATVAPWIGVALGHADERRQLGTERLGEAVHEEVVCRPGGKVVRGVDVSHRHALIPAGDDAVVEAVDLEPAVITAGVVAGGGHHAEGAAVERHHDGGGVDVVVLGEQRVALDGAGRVHLDGALSGDPVAARRSRARRSRGRCRRSP